MADGGCFVDLYWLPVGAGAISRPRQWSLDAWEAFEAWRARRPRARLCHSALKLRLADGTTHTIELTPVSSGEHPDRAMTGSVGFRWAGRARFFRYQVRREAHDTLPDEAWVIEPPTRIADGCEAAERVYRLAASIPSHTWGRRVRGTSEVWTSDSAMSWLVAEAGFDARAITAPTGWRAPGWRAGQEVRAG